MTLQLNDQEYFEWLISQIEIRNRRTFNELFVRMHLMEFVFIPTISGDDNRVQDARDLRTEFLNGFRGAWRGNFNGWVSVLEVVIALSRRIAFIAGGYPEFWAWQLIENLGLDKYPDTLNLKKSHLIDDILESLVWRTYSPDGRGGFFPLDHPTEDQTKIEVWDQMNSYINAIQE